MTIKVKFRRGHTREMFPPRICQFFGQGCQILAFYVAATGFLKNSKIFVVLKVCARSHDLYIHSKAARHKNRGVGLESEN